jgi:hypothetical protein
MNNLDYFKYEYEKDEYGNTKFDEYGYPVRIYGPIVDQVRKQEFSKLYSIVQKRIKLLIGMNGDEECIQTLEWVLDIMNKLETDEIYRKEINE